MEQCSSGPRRAHGAFGPCRRLRPANDADALIKGLSADAKNEDGVVKAFRSAAVSVGSIRRRDALGRGKGCQKCQLTAGEASLSFQFAQALEERFRPLPKIVLRAAGRRRFRGTVRARLCLAGASGMQGLKTPDLLLDLTAAGADRPRTADDPSVEGVLGQGSADALADDLCGDTAGFPLGDQPRIRIGEGDTIPTAGQEKGLDLFKKRGAVRQEAHGAWWIGMAA